MPFLKTTATAFLAFSSSALGFTTFDSAPRVSFVEPMAAESTTSLRGSVKRALAGSLETKHIANATEFETEFKDFVNAGTKCGLTKYTVSDSLFGSVITYHGDSPSSLEDRWDMAWLSDHNTIADLFNTNCCGLSPGDFTGCYCAVANAVGLSPADMPPGQGTDYVVFEGKSSSGELRAGSSAVTSPSWGNLLDLIPSTLEDVLKDKAPKCKITAEVKAFFNQPSAVSTDGSSWNQFFEDPASRDAMASFGCRKWENNAGGCVHDDLATGTPDLVKYLEGGNDLCASPAALRYYMLFAFGANPLFGGGSKTPDGSIEYVAIPSPKISGLPGFGSIRFYKPEDGVTCPK